MMKMIAANTAWQGHHKVAISLGGELVRSHRLEDQAATILMQGDGLDSNSRGFVHGWGDPGDFS